MTTNDPNARAAARPGDEILADYASGTLSPGLSLLVASHLTYAPESRARVAALEAIGGAMLSAEPPTAAPPDLAATLARLDGAPDPAPAPPARRPGSVLPAPLLAELGADETALKWKFRLPGLSECVLDGFGEDEEVSILRARPGASIFSHTHSGVEATLVMSGRMLDRGRELVRGDVSIATDEVDHRPRILGTETCYCLIVMTGSLRFTGPLSRALNLFGD